LTSSLHGHTFQVLARSDTDSGPYPGTLPSYATASPPLRRDTIQVKAGGYVVIRFRADNPGINLFHCHIEWHVEAGLTATFIEAPLELQKKQKDIPDDHLAACKAQNIPSKGNCGGNSDDYLDVSKCPTVPEGNPWG
jgi:iron transport multicopper oxidase